MKYFLTVLVAGVAVLAGCSGGPPPVDADQLEEREDGLMYFKEEPFTGNASSKKEAAYAALKLANLTYQNGDLIRAKAMVEEVLNNHGNDLDIKQVADQLDGLIQVGIPSLN